MTTVIGLTGGIASGKSAVSGILARRGAFVIDADAVGHEAYLPGSDCFKDVVEAFGDDIVAEDGTIDRRALGARVFAEPDERRRLESIVWPWMRETMEHRLDQLRREDRSIVVLEAAVLVEADWVDLVDRVWVVTVEPAIARQRLVERNGLTPEQADQRISAQVTNERRSERADTIIDNNGTLEDLRASVDAAWERLASGPGRNA